MAELEQIVRKLEQGGSSLEDDLTDYGRAVELIKQCHHRLTAAERSVELLSGVDSEGRPVSEPFQLLGQPSEIAVEKREGNEQTSAENAANSPKRSRPSIDDPG